MQPANYPSCQRNTARAKRMQPEGCTPHLYCQHHAAYIWSLPDGCSIHLVHLFRLFQMQGATHHPEPQLSSSLPDDHRQIWSLPTANIMQHTSGSLQQSQTDAGSLNYHRACQLPIMPEKHRQSKADAARRMQPANYPPPQNHAPHRARIIMGCNKSLHPTIYHSRQMPCIIPCSLSCTFPLLSSLSLHTKHHTFQIEA